MDGQNQSSRRELQGPRPTPLKVRKESHKIKKPPVAPQLSGAPPQHPPPRQPIIIYAVSPKVIHTSPTGFMSLVQRLTGPSASSSSSSSSATSVFTGGKDVVSPAARLAVMEMTKMPLNEKSFDFSDIRSGEGFMQGILSPGPGGLAWPVPATLFSPFSDLSPLVNLYHQQNSLAGGGTGGSVFSSPSAGAFLSPNPMLSPASIEFLRRLLDQ